MATAKEHEKFVKDWISANFCDGEDRSEAENDTYSVTLLDMIGTAKDLLTALIEEFPELAQSEEYTTVYTGPELYECFMELTPDEIL